MSPTSSAKTTRDRLAAAAATRPRSPAPSDEPHTPTPRGGRQTKYTVLLDPTDEQTIQDFVYHARRDLGVLVGKSDVYRAFLALLRDDPQLSGRVRDYVLAAKAAAQP